MTPDKERARMSERDVEAWDGLAGTATAHIDALEARLRDITAENAALRTEVAELRRDELERADRMSGRADQKAQELADAGDRLMARDRQIMVLRAELARLEKVCEQSVEDASSSASNLIIRLQGAARKAAALLRQGEGREVPETCNGWLDDDEARKPCRIVEYDGAYKCLEHGRTWGAVTNPEEPCEASEGPEPDAWIGASHGRTWKHGGGIHVSVYREARLAGPDAVPVYFGAAPSTQHVSRRDVKRREMTEYAHPARDLPDTVRSSLLITTVRVEEGPGHDQVHVWNRGGKAGVLVVNSGDGEKIAHRLLQQ